MQLTKKQYQDIEKIYYEAREDERKLEEKDRKGTITKQETTELIWLSGYTWGLAHALNAIDKGGA